MLHLTKKMFFLTLHFFVFDNAIVTVILLRFLGELFILLFDTYHKLHITSSIYKYYHIKYHFTTF